MVLGKAEGKTKKCMLYFPCPQVACVFYLFIVKAKVLENFKCPNKICLFCLVFWFFVFYHLRFCNVFTNNGSVNFFEAHIVYF